MRKILFLLLCTGFCLSCSEDFDSKKEYSGLSSENNLKNSKLPSQEPCLVGTHPVLSYEFDGIRLHRASTGCESRFSICSDGHWEVNCIDDRDALSKYNPNTDRVLVSGVLINNQENLELHFPIELMSSPTFETEDFETFGFDEDYKVYEGITIKAGEYIPTYKNDEIMVKVDLL